MVVERAFFNGPPVGGVSAHALSYRPEIDGLRALAILPVVLFHYGLGPFRGGFVGVDVFFVISGYLITALIHGEMEDGRFSIVRFYERRVRRIFPALFAMLAVASVAAGIILFPYDLVRYAKSLLATAAFASNFEFWNEAGYFDVAAAGKPLLHLWSIAVEEQFYLLFPLVLLAFPVLVFVVGPRRLPGFLARAAAPGVLLLAVAAAANWTATIHAVTSQPNSPQIDHPTPWIYLAPHLADDQVAAGPARILALIAACGCGLLAWHSWRAHDMNPSAPGAGATGWSTEKLQEVLWWTAVALALRSVFEPVMVAYYLWPPLALALIPASRDWKRLLGAGTTAIVLTFFSQIHWHNPWSWWTPMIALLALTLFLTRPGGVNLGRANLGRARRGQLSRGGGSLSGTPEQVLPEPGEQFIADRAP